MNDAHLHMVVNHFPIIGTIFGLGILLAGLLFKNNVLKNTAYFIFIIAAIFGFLSMNTGEGAEEIVEDFPNIGKQIIHEHEEIAEKLALVLYVLAATSILGLYLNTKKHSKAALLSFFVLIVSIIAVFLAQQVGTSGGEIRHTEIRESSVNTEIPNEKNDEEKSNGDD